ncbi:hypothetical protein GCM10017687_35930 [Streptomyces echinatus]
MRRPSRWPRWTPGTPTGRTGPRPRWPRPSSALADAEEFARNAPDEARARAADIIAEARAREELIAQETEQVLREHGDTWDDVQAHMDSVRDSLISLTGRVTME